MTKELLASARKAREQAYAPYSGFRVGAALLCADGRVFTGCNVENASYGLTNCAERTAVFKAVSEGARDFVRLAVCADGEDVVAPCGACRQVLAEFAPQMEIVLANLSGKVITITLEELLPLAFGSEYWHKEEEML